MAYNGGHHSFSTLRLLRYLFAGLDRKLGGGISCLIYLGGILQRYFGLFLVQEATYDQPVNYCDVMHIVLCQALSLGDEDEHITRSTRAVIGGKAC